MFGEDGRPDIPRDQLRARADALQRQMLDLRLLRDAVRHVADCPAPSHLECPTFRKLLKATRGRATRPSSGIGRRGGSQPDEQVVAGFRASVHMRRLGSRRVSDRKRSEQQMK